MAFNFLSANVQMLLKIKFETMAVSILKNIETKKLVIKKNWNGGTKNLYKTNEDKSNMAI